MTLFDQKRGFKDVRSRMGVRTAVEEEETIYIRSSMEEEEEEDKRMMKCNKKVWYIPTRSPR